MGVKYESGGIVASPDNQHIDTILVDHEISPSQARNLEKEVGCEVMDRAMVILEIFHRNARSRAAQAQVESPPRVHGTNVCARRRSSQGRKGGSVAASVVAGAGSRTLNSTGARSITTSLNFNRK